MIYLIPYNVNQKYMYPPFNDRKCPVGLIQRMFCQTDDTYVTNKHDVSRSTCMYVCVCVVSTDLKDVKPSFYKTMTT